MDIIHKFKCNFSVQKDQRANFLHGLQKMGIQCALMYNISKLLFQTFYQESEHFISIIYLLELLMIFHKADLFSVRSMKTYVQLCENENKQSLHLNIISRYLQERAIK